MSERGLLIDNDVFVILGGSGLLNEAISTLGFSWSSVFRLEALHHMLCKGRTFALYPLEVRNAALELCETVAPLRDTPNPDLAQALAAVKGIDEGEAVFFALMAEHSHYLLTTHDKHALRALHRTAAVQRIRAEVAGRIICLETVLLQLIDRLGVAAVAEALEPVLPTNTELRAIFTPGNVAQPAECINGLWLYQLKLEQEVGADLLWKPRS